MACRHREIGDCLYHHIGRRRDNGMAKGYEAKRMPSVSEARIVASISAVLVSFIVALVSKISKRQ